VLRSYHFSVIEGHVTHRKKFKNKNKNKKINPLLLFWVGISKSRISPPKIKN
jgi:hypothetical protein